MEHVNALKIRNHLGEILDRLNTTGEPVLISKGRKIRAVLVTPEQFQRRFMDYQAKDEKEKFLNLVDRMKRKKAEGIDSVEFLRHLRGYTE